MGNENSADSYNMLESSYHSMCIYTASYTYDRMELVTMTRQGGVDCIVIYFCPHEVKHFPPLLSR